MGKTLSSTVQLRIVSTHINTRTTDIADVVATDPLVLNLVETLSNGTTSGSADLLYHERIVESGASETIFDLDTIAASPGNFDGDAFGDDVSFSFVKVLMVRHVSGPTGTLLIGGTTADQWFDIDMLFATTNSQLFVPVGGAFIMYAPEIGWPVDSNSKDKFIINTSATATYDIVIIGTSA